MMSPMTHHYTTLTTEDWIESQQGRTDFLDWLAGESDDTLMEQVQVALIGWAPLHRIGTLETTREWLYELRHDHPAADMLHGRFVEYWLGTDREHTSFHAWGVRRYGSEALCGTCWT